MINFSGHKSLKMFALTHSREEKKHKMNRLYIFHALYSSKLTFLMRRKFKIRQISLYATALPFLLFYCRSIIMTTIIFFIRSSSFLLCVIHMVMRRNMMMYCIRVIMLCSFFSLCCHATNLHSDALPEE